jgi:hypothetical protein
MIAVNLVMRRGLGTFRRIVWARCLSRRSWLMKKKGKELERRKRKGRMRRSRRRRRRRAARTRLLSARTRRESNVVVLETEVEEELRRKRQQRQKQWCWKLRSARPFEAEAVWPYALVDLLLSWSVVDFSSSPFFFPSVSWLIMGCCDFLFLGSCEECVRGCSVGRTSGHRRYTLLWRVVYHLKTEPDLE